MTHLKAGGVRLVDDGILLRQWMLDGIAGDGAAHGQLLQAIALRLRNFFRARGLQASDAEDLVQDVLIAIHTKRGLYDPSKPLLAWVYAIARYRLIDRYRREGRRGIHVPIDDWENALAAESAEAGDPSRDIARLLYGLSDKQRRSIELVKLQEKSVAEASAVTGWSQSDIKTSIFRGIRALQRLVSANSDIGAI